jgi:hypothetical protein
MRASPGFPSLWGMEQRPKVSASGSEDSISSLHSRKLVGSFRTYVYTGNQGLSMEAWFDSMKKGGAFVSSESLLELKVNGLLPGDAVQLPAGGGPVELTGCLRSVTNLEDVALVCNGLAVERFLLRRNTSNVDISYSRTIDRSGWRSANSKPRIRQLRHPLDRPAATISRSLVAEAWPGWRFEREQAQAKGSEQLDTQGVGVP